jgi:outer membrane receptor protein involved in Fe transport
MNQPTPASTAPPSAPAAAALGFGDAKAAGGCASIRGIGTGVFTTAAESSVGMVMDGVPLGSTAGGALFDLERIERLRGPRGTLFGKNASAGALNMSTKAPEFNHLPEDLAGQGGRVVSRGQRAGERPPRSGTPRRPALAGPAPGPSAHRPARPRPPARGLTRL